MSMLCLWMEKWWSVSQIRFQGLDLVSFLWTSCLEWGMEVRNADWGTRLEYD
jgi:hypothetical protein